MDRTASPWVLRLEAIVAALLLAAPAWATDWWICNNSAENVDVAIVYNLNDARQYISRGWWTLRACGGCKLVFRGDLPITGTFVRAEGSEGSVWEGDNLFCTSPAAFEIPNANVDENTCKARGQDQQAFFMQHITSRTFTTRLQPPLGSQRVCID